MTYPEDPLWPPTPSDGYAVPPELYRADEPLISPDINGWWARGIAIVKAGWGPLALLQGVGALVSVLVGGGIAVYALAALPNLNPAPGTPPPTPDDAAPILFGILGVTLAGVAVTGFVSLLVTLMSVHIVGQLASGRRPEFGVAVRAALPRIAPLFGWSLLSGLIMLGGLCACVLPFFYFLAVFTVLAPVVMFERGPAVGRCFRLFHGNLGASVGRIAIIVGIGVGVSVLSQGISTGLSRAAGTELTARIVVVVVSAVIGALLRAGVGVLTAPLTVLAYADERSRIEPVRSADLIAALGLGPAPYPAAP